MQDIDKYNGTILIWIKSKRSDNWICKQLEKRLPNISDIIIKNHIKTLKQTVIGKTE